MLIYIMELRIWIMIYTKYSKIYGSFIKHEVSLDKDQRECGLLLSARGMRVLLQYLVAIQCRHPSQGKSACFYIPVYYIVAWF